MVEYFFEEKENFVKKKYHLKYVFIFFFQKKLDDYLYLYIRNLENSRLKQPVFRQTISICIYVGRWKILSGYCVV